ncbi:hypothetical protein CENDO_10235 [Corynebacterium endometrii]|uniref:Uncharacterized protein n=1 Tax=Corynebacterium endometrii TaxID=2488819 RepID=A0A4P7QHM5_9CORY|nr:hypothetical protein CENDO_10235 [Corynebacterium endometrii]
MKLTPDSKYRYTTTQDLTCSSLAWAAYMVATNGVIDLDADGGLGVNPSDVRDDDQVSPY